MCAENSTSSYRLKEERERLGLQQKDVYPQIEVSRGTYKSYEEGGTSPTAEHLRVLSKMGFDVSYIVTGQRQASAIKLDQVTIDILASRGIALEEDKRFRAVVVTFSSAGMAWLLNYQAAHDNAAPMLSWSFLSALAAFEPDGAWRPLRIKAAGLPVGDAGEYFVYFFYLDGSPPRQMHMFRPDGRQADGGAIRYSATRERPFRVDDSQDVVIQLSNKEHDELIAGGVVVVDPCKGPSGPGAARAVERSSGEVAPLANVGGPVGQIVQGDATFSGTTKISVGKPKRPRSKKPE